MSDFKKNLSELQVFSGIAILCVVLIHSNAYYLLNILNLERYTDAGFLIRLLDNFIHGAVPLFIFIAGYKYALNNINSNYKSYAIKKINSVIKPFLVISMMFFMLRIVKNWGEFNNFKIVILEFIKIFIGYNIAYQLWYIPMYLFITLTYPIIYNLLKSNKIRLTLILVAVVIQGILSNKFIILSQHPFDFIYYYLFFEMGVCFCKYNIKNKIKECDTKIIVIHIFMVIILTMNPIPQYYSLIQKYILWPLCIVSYYKLSLKLKDNKLLQYLGKYSFYIFLLHEPIICSGISMVIKKLGIYNSIFYVFIVSILTIICSIALYKIIENTFIKDILFNKSKKHNSLLEDKDTTISDVKYI